MTSPLSLVAPQFELFEKVDFENFIRESMLPAAAEFAEKGKLPKGFLDEFGRFEKEYDRYDDLDERRVVEDLVLATRFFEAEGSCTAAAPRADVKMLVAGMDAAKIYYQGTDGKTQTIANDTEVCVWDPNEDQLANRADIYHSIQAALPQRTRPSPGGPPAVPWRTWFSSTRTRTTSRTTRATPTVREQNQYDKAREFAERVLELKSPSPSRVTRTRPTTSSLFR